MGIAVLAGVPPTVRPVVANILADESVMEGGENERGDVRVHGDDGRCYDENETMNAMNGLGSCGGVQSFGPGR